jgi:uncharacterized ferritin-like protein (DUF455 family)
MHAEQVEDQVGLVDGRRALTALMFACERLAEIAAGVLVRHTDVEVKLALSREIWVLAQARTRLGERIAGLRTTAVQAQPAGPGYVEFTNQIVSLQNPEIEDSALVHLAFPDLRDAFLAHRARIPKMADEETAERLTDILQKFDAVRLGGRPAPHCLLPLERSLSDCGGVLGAAGAQDAPSVSPVPALAMIPLRPGRAAHMLESTPQSGTRPAGYGPALHDLAFRIELCAAEICACLLAHHADQPWELRHDLAKQTRDEARHFELFMEHARSLGTQIGACPVQFEVWDKFILGRTLEERIIIQQRIGEGTALDGAETLHARLKADGQHDLAQVFEYITADEVCHVAVGNKWLRRMLGDQAAILAAEEEILARLGRHGMAPVYKHPINVADRMLSGFTELELDVARQLHSAP